MDFSNRGVDCFVRLVSTLGGVTRYCVYLHDGEDVATPRYSIKPRCIALVRCRDLRTQDMAVEEAF
jgi:hypothetical protein